MEKVIALIEQFLLNNAWGVIIAGIIASVLGALLCYVFRKTVDFFRKKYQVRKNKQYFFDYALGYYRGLAAGYSMNSSYRQILLVGDFVLGALFSGLKIIAYLLITSILICALDNIFLDLAMVALCSFMIYPQIVNLKEIRKGYVLIFKKIFGEDFMQKAVDGAIESLKKRQNEKNNAE